MLENLTQPAPHPALQYKKRQSVKFKKLPPEIIEKIFNLHPPSFVGVNKTFHSYAKAAVGYTTELYNQSHGISHHTTIATGPYRSLHFTEKHALVVPVDSSKIQVYDKLTGKLLSEYQSPDKIIASCWDGNKFFAYTHKQHTLLTLELSSNGTLSLEKQAEFPLPQFNPAPPKIFLFKPDSPRGLFHQAYGDAPKLFVDEKSVTLQFQRQQTLSVLLYTFSRDKPNDPPQIFHFSLLDDSNEIPTYSVSGPHFFAFSREGKVFYRHLPSGKDKPFSLTPPKQGGTPSTCSVQGNRLFVVWHNGTYATIQVWDWTAGTFIKESKPHLFRPTAPNQIAPHSDQSPLLVLSSPHSESDGVFNTETFTWHKQPQLKTGEPREVINGQPVSKTARGIRVFHYHEPEKSSSKAHRIGIQILREKIYLAAEKPWLALVTLVTKFVERLRLKSRLRSYQNRLSEEIKLRANRIAQLRQIQRLYTR